MPESKDLIDLRTHEDPQSPFRIQLVASLERDLFRSSHLVNAILGEVVQKVSDKIVEIYLEDNLQDILKSMDTKAIANLAVAQAGIEIKDSLKKDGGKFFEVESLGEDALMLIQKAYKKVLEEREDGSS